MCATAGPTLGRWASIRIADTGEQRSTIGSWVAQWWCVPRWCSGRLLVDHWLVTPSDESIHECGSVLGLIGGHDKHPFVDKVQA